MTYEIKNFTLTRFEMVKIGSSFLSKGVKCDGVLDIHTYVHKGLEVFTLQKIKRKRKYTVLVH